MWYWTDIITTIEAPLICVVVGLLAFWFDLDGLGWWFFGLAAGHPLGVLHGRKMYE